MTAGRTVNPLSHHWCTPKKYTDAVHRFFGGQVALDPCSNQHSIVNAQLTYALPDEDGLALSWNYRTIYVNPPYGSDRQRGTTIKHWMALCHKAHQAYGSEVLALIPVATNTSHWKLYVWKSASAIAFLADTRLKFLVNGEDGGKGAPMSCAMVYWGAQVDRFQKVFAAYGAVITLDKQDTDSSAMVSPAMLQNSLNLINSEERYGHISL